MPESVTDRPARSHEYIFLLTKSATYFYDREAVLENGAYPAGTRAAKGSSERQAQNGVNARPPEYATYTGKRNLRSVWAFSGGDPETAKLPHYASFQVLLPTTCIKAGSPEIACQTCGKGWTRVVERNGLTPRQRGEKSGWNSRTLETGGQGLDYVGGHGSNARAVSTTGFAPACSCGPAPGPSVVLDPFSGTGTSGVVALRHGRRYIGIELSEAYVALSEKRLAAEIGLFDGYERGKIEPPPVEAQGAQGELEF